MQREAITAFQGPLGGTEASSKDSKQDEKPQSTS
jgi:hypothetical protein